MAQRFLCALGRALGDVDTGRPDDGVDRVREGLARADRRDREGASSSKDKWDCTIEAIGRRAGQAAVLCRLAAQAEAHEYSRWQSEALRYACLWPRIDHTPANNILLAALAAVHARLEATPEDASPDLFPDERRNALTALYRTMLHAPLQETDWAALSLQTALALQTYSPTGMELHLEFGDRNDPDEVYRAMTVMWRGCALMASEELRIDPLETVLARLGEREGNVLAHPLARWIGEIDTDSLELTISNVYLTLDETALEHATLQAQTIYVGAYATPFHTAHFGGPGRMFNAITEALDHELSQTVLSFVQTSCDRLPPAAPAMQRVLYELIGIIAGVQFMDSLDPCIHQCVPRRVRVATLWTLADALADGHRAAANEVAPGIVLATHAGLFIAWGRLQPHPALTALVGPIAPATEDLRAAIVTIFSLVSLDP